MQVWCDWQLTLCDPHLSALEVRFHDDALYKSMFTLPYLSIFFALMKSNCFDSGFKARDCRLPLKLCTIVTNVNIWVCDPGTSACMILT